MKVEEMHLLEEMVQEVSGEEMVQEVRGEEMVQEVRMEEMVQEVREEEMVQEVRGVEEMCSFNLQACRKTKQARSTCVVASLLGMHGTENLV